jgi:hypothetical protein
LDRRIRHTEAEAFLETSRLSERAGVTRAARPNLAKIRKLYRGGDRLTSERAAFIQKRTDRRILQAAVRYLNGEWLRS